VKRLTILRHAKSDWGDPGADDHDRPLNERGRNAARAIGREMNRRGMRFDHVLASTALRVRQTLDGLREQCRIEAEIDFEPRVYGATEEMLLYLIRGLPEGAQSALLVGHNPGLGRLLVDLTHDDPNGLRKEVAGKYPAGALAIVELPAEQWTDVKPASGEIAALILPRDLD
jgi:phosphohistidine phosphatase